MCEYSCQDGLSSVPANQYLSMVSSSFSPLSYAESRCDSFTKQATLASVSCGNFGGGDGDGMTMESWALLPRCKRVE